MVSKALSLTAAMVLTYLGSRFWTFRHRVNQALLREGVLFAALNLVGLAIAECIIAFVTYGLDLRGTVAYNAASVFGTGLGTIFRYFSYKKWVFLAGVPGTAVAAGEAAMSGIVDSAETSGTGPVLAGAVLAGAVDGHHASHQRGSSSSSSNGHASRYQPLHARGEDPGRAREDERGYGPPWELLDTADARHR
jgi:hypothetical protein